MINRKSKYLGSYVKNDLSWDEHILETSKYELFHSCSSPSSQNISQRVVTKSVWVVHTIETGVWFNDMGLYYWYKPMKIQRIQRLATRIMTGNFDYIHSRGVDIVHSLNLQTVKERRGYFLCVLVFKCIHDLAHNYLCNYVTMYVDIHGYDTRSGENMDSYMPRVIKDIYKRSFRYMTTTLWNHLPTDDSFNRKYKYSKCWIKWCRWARKHKP